MSERRERLRPWEWGVVVLLLLVAFGFRVHRLSDAPPGAHHDDTKNVLLVQRILEGYVRVYYPENYGHEPLFHWLQAAWLGVMGAETWYPEIRLLSVYVSMAGLALIAALARRLLGRRVALWTLAWQAVSLWPLFYSRRAIRGILLPGLAALAGLLFVAGLDDGPKPFRRRWAAWALGGVALAACLYTYPGSRVLPLFFLALAGAVALVDRDRFQARWRGVALFFAVAALLSAPLWIYLIGHPEERMGQISQPVDALLAGDPLPLLRNSARALGMFTFLGDPHWRQYVADTPVFEPLGAILFYAGIVLALRRLREWRALYPLLWTPVALLPAMLSEGAPNFLRPIAVQSAVYFLPALAMDALVSWAGRRRALGWAAIGGLVALLGLNAARTYEGYFLRWAAHPEARFAYSTTLLREARYLDSAPEVDAVVLSGLLPADLDPAFVDGALRRADLQPRWCDLRQSLVYPGGEAALVLRPDYYDFDPLLLARFVEGGAPAVEERWEDGSLVFAGYGLDRAALDAFLSAADKNPVGWSGAARFPGGLPADWAPLAYPVDFGGRVELLGYQVLPGDGRSPGAGATVLTAWRALTPGPAEAITFLHALDAEGAVVAGSDSFGAPPNRWLPGDVIVQLHRLALPESRSPAALNLELGWYERDSGARWAVTLPGGGQVDRLLLQPVQVEDGELARR